MIDLENPRVRNDYNGVAATSTAIGCQSGMVRHEALSNDNTSRLSSSFHVAAYIQSCTGCEKAKRKKGNDRVDHVELEHEMVVTGRDGLVIRDGSVRVRGRLDGVFADFAHAPGTTG